MTSIIDDLEDIANMDVRVKTKPLLRFDGETFRTWNNPTVAAKAARTGAIRRQRARHAAWRKSKEGET